MAKKIVSIFYIMLVALFFCGCSQVAYTVAQLPNGAIVQNISVTIDKKVLDSQGISYDYVVSCVKEGIDDAIDEMIAIATNSGVYVYDMSLFPQSFMAGMGYSRAKTSSGEIIGQLHYDTYNIYCLVHDIDPTIEPEKEIISGLLYDREILASGTLIFASQTTSDICQNVESKIKSQYPDTTFSFSNVDCVYAYALPLSYCKVNRIRTNASYYHDEEYTSSESLRYFVWNYNHNNPDFEMVIYRNIVHNYMWYILAIILTGVFMLALFIAHKIKLSSKKNNIIVQEPLDFNEQSN